MARAASRAIVTALRGVRADRQEFPIEVGRTVLAAQWAALVGTSQSAIVRLAVGGRIETWNRGAEDLFGLAAHEAIGRAITVLEPAGEGVFTEPVKTAGAGRTAHLEAVIHRRDGRQADVEVSVAPIFGRRREVIGVLWVAVDISERKRAHGELARLADAAQHGTDAVISVDLEGRICHWSEGAAKLYGFSAEEAIGRDFRRLTMLAEEPSVNAADVLAGAPSHQYEARRRRKDGAIIEVLATVIPWRVGGKLVGVTGIAIDITARRRAEADLRQSEQRLRTIFDGAPIGVALACATAPFELVQANVALAEMLAVMPAELAGRPADTLIDASDREIARAHLQRLAAGEQCASHIELSIRGHASELRRVSVNGAMINGEGGEAEHLVLQAAGHHRPQAPRARAAQLRRARSAHGTAQSPRPGS